jgi:hypothetical protein
VNSRSAGQRACDAGWPVVRLFATRLQSPTPAAQSSTNKNPHGIAQLVLQFTTTKNFFVVAKERGEKCAEMKCRAVTAGHFARKDKNFMNYM